MTSEGRENIMKKEKKSCGLRKIIMVVGGVTLTVAGFIVIPPVLEKYSSRVYKSSLKREKMDFDHMEPEIVPYNKRKGE